MLKRILGTCALVLGVVAGPLVAEDTALILRNNNFEKLPDLTDPSARAQARLVLQRHNFRTLDLQNQSAYELVRGLRRFKSMLGQGESDRVVVFASGHTLSTLRNSWFLGVQAGQPDQFSVPQQSVSLNAVMRLLADYPGRALMVVAEHETALEIPKGLKAGLRSMDPPQGVTVIHAPANSAMDVLGMVLTPGVSVADIISEKDVRVTGYAAGSHSFTPSDEAGPANHAALKEEAYFQLSVDIGTATALNAYLKRYPSGRYAVRARGLLQDLNNSATREAEQAERALNLSRDDRRSIQENLTLLGHDTRGVDGVFGRGTRAAIKTWQADQNLAVTGYLRSAQVTRIERQAKKQRKESEEVRKNKDRMDWQVARKSNTLAGYRQYLNTHPEGEYRENAIKRLADLGGVWVTEVEIKRAREEEARHLKNPLARMLVEQRLASLGHSTGRIDGAFSDQTRSAIQAFQSKSGIMATGYVDTKTLNALLP